MLMPGLIFSEHQPNLRLFETKKNIFKKNQPQMNQPSWFIRGSHLENSGRFLLQLVAPPPIGWLEDLLILNQHMLTHVDH